MDSTAVIFTEKVTLELVKNLPAMLWFLLACLIVILLYKPIRHELLPNLSGLKAMGVEFSFVKNSITTAIELAKKSPHWKVVIPEEDQQRVLNRVKKHLDLFQETRILWIDDNPETLRSERKMLQRLQTDIDLAKNSGEAERLLQINEYDLILSDIARGDNRRAGLEFLANYARRENRARVIFYVGYLQPEKGVPPYAFGITHRPDELLHLILDVLERKQV